MFVVVAAHVPFTWQRRRGAPSMCSLNPVAQVPSDVEPGEIAENAALSTNVAGQFGMISTNGKIGENTYRELPQNTHIGMAG